MENSRSLQGHAAHTATRVDQKPFAEMLRIPEEVFKPRRTNAHYLAFIEMTFYHQYQRQEQADDNGEVYIETTIEDIREANALMKEILLCKSDDLNGACRNYFERLKDWMKQEDKNTFTNVSARQALRIKGTTLRRYHNQLLDAGLLQHRSGKKATGYHYELTSPEEYEQLTASITSILDEMLQKCATAPAVSQSQNGSPKPKRTKKVKAVRQ